MGDSSYKGVSASQDSRFTNKESTLLRKLKFPAHFVTKVDMAKVELSVMKPWIARRVTELLGFEDDVVLEYAMGMLEEERFPDPKKVQIQLMGFLEAKTGEFMSELWELLISAQSSLGGVPQRFVEEKKEELRKKREEGERVVREARERAQRAAEAAGGGDVGREGKRKSRWDAGAPSTSLLNRGAAPDTRPPAYSAGGERDQHPHRDDHRRRNDLSRSEWNRRRADRNYTFEDRNGNTTDRSRDSGWGSRAPPPSRQGDSWRPSSSRRSPSPPPRTRHRSRSRSRSVTPDYRETIRKTKSSKKEKHMDEDALNRLREKIRDQPVPGRQQDAYERDANLPAFRDMDFPDTESEDSRAAEERRQKESRSDLSSDDSEFRPPSSS